MDEKKFQAFLKRGGRSPSAVRRCQKFVGEYDRFLEEHCEGITIDRAGGQELESFVFFIEKDPKTSAKTHLWAIRYYYEFIGDEEMRAFASNLRQQRIKRKPFPLKKFRGVDHDHTGKLAAIGIKNANQMLEAGRKPADRKSLAAKTGIPLESILELVKLSDLSRIGAVKTIRARLYHDGGIDTVEKMAELEPEELRNLMIDFVERTCFDGIAPLPKEAEYTIRFARKLPKIIEYD